MEKADLNPSEPNHGTQIPDPCIISSCNHMERRKDKFLNQETESFVVEEGAETEADSVICDSGSRLVQNGFHKPNCTEEIVLFVNVGAETSSDPDSDVSFVADKYFEGGDTFQTEELIIEGGEYPFIYQSARLGEFSYQIDNLPPGDYFVDLHFVEIINVYGPKGMRIFNVFMQDEKILSDFDIYSIVGANKPLQLVDVRVSIKDDGLLVLRFEGILGSPIVSGICVRRASTASAPVPPLKRRLVCTNCATEIEYTSAQKKIKQMKSTAKYEEKIKELSDMLQRKTDECYQSWMSWTTANDQLEKVRMELDNKTFKTYSLDQTLEKQADKLREISGKYDHDKETWAAAINNLDYKIREMKQQHLQLSREAHDCANSIPDLSKMVFAVQALVEQCEDLKVKYNEEQMKRRKLYNQLQEAKGNIRVFCRCRPLSKSEALAGCASVVDFDAAKDGELGILSTGSGKKHFKFDRVYTPKDNQDDVYADASPVVISVLDGYNVCIFAYGQTGTGKTFTMEGTEANRGVNYRTLEELFKIANERSETFSFDISVSVLEVYNEQIRDLLATSTSKKLEIKQASEGFHHIPGIVEARVENTNQVWNVLQAGSSARAVGSNNVNEHSSRSHCMLCIMVRSKNLITGECTKSKLWLVDLAGSERLAKTDVQGERLKEAQNINRSLSALGDVISALANKSSHIPYRNSKLTHLLQDSLGGDSKTLMFVQISPSDKDLSETLSSLNFAIRVRGVELGPARKQIDTSEVQKMKMMLEKARQECKSKDESLRKLEDSLQNLESKVKGKDQTYKNQLDKIKELEAQLDSRTSLHCQSEKQVSHLMERLKGKEETCLRLQEKVMDLENKLKQREEIESSMYQKVIDMENKLKEQVQESESHSILLRHQVEELQKKLKEQEQNSEFLLPYERIKELEDKVREQQKQLASQMVSEPASQLQSAPMEDKPVVGEIMNEAECRILRSLNSSKSHTGKGPVVVKENNSHHDVRTKRLSRHSETENNSVVPTPVSSNKGRQSDPPRPFSKVSKASKPVISAQRPLIRNKLSRDPVEGTKERDSKKRMWSR